MALCFSMDASPAAETGSTAGFSLEPVASGPSGKQANPWTVHRHLGVRHTTDEIWTTMADPGSSLPSVLPRTESTADVDEKLIAQFHALEQHIASQSKTFSSLEARLAACETAVAVASPVTSDTSHGPQGRLVAARVAALEGAHQAEIADLRRALNEAVSLGHEHDQQQRRHKACVREMEQQLEEATRRVEDFKQASMSVQRSVEQMGTTLDGMERRGASLEHVLTAAEGGLARLGSLLEAKERRTADLGQAISSADEGVRRVMCALDAQVQRLQEVESRSISQHNSELDLSITQVGRGDNEPVWQALRELQELVVHESEHRAAGLREILGVLGQGVEQVRAECAQQLADLESQMRAEHRRIKQRISDSQSRHMEQERRAEALDVRIDGLVQSLSAERAARVETVAWVEDRIREISGSSYKDSTKPCKLRKDATTCNKNAPLDMVSSSAPQIGQPANQADTWSITSQSMQRLEALEARFDLTARAGSNTPTAREPAETAHTGISNTEGALGKLRGQLEGLRSELASGDVRNSASMTTGSSGSEANLQMGTLKHVGDDVKDQACTSDRGAGFGVVHHFGAPCTCVSTDVATFPTPPCRQAPIVRCYSAPPGALPVRHVVPSGSRASSPPRVHIVRATTPAVIGAYPLTATPTILTTGTTPSHVDSGAVTRTFDCIPTNVDLARPAPCLHGPMVGPHAPQPPAEYEPYVGMPASSGAPQLLPSSVIHASASHPPAVGSVMTHAPSVDISARRIDNMGMSSRRSVPVPPLDLPPKNHWASNQIGGSKHFVTPGSRQGDEISSEAPVWSDIAGDFNLKCPPDHQIAGGHTPNMGFGVSRSHSDLSVPRTGPVSDCSLEMQPQAPAAAIRGHNQSAGQYVSQGREQLVRTFTLTSQVGKARLSPSSARHRASSPSQESVCSSKQ